MTNKQNNVVQVLKEQIELVLGTPDSDKKWLNKFYNLRSRLVYGDLPIIRLDAEDMLYSKTEGYYLQFYESIKKSFAVLLALLQNLIISFSIGFEFHQNYTYKKNTN